MKWWKRKQKDDPRLHWYRSNNIDDDTARAELSDFDEMDRLGLDHETVLGYKVVSARANGPHAIFLLDDAPAVLPFWVLKESSSHWDDHASRRREQLRRGRILTDDSYQGTPSSLMEGVL
jgi:hypothetical protein